jgi:hypothetical protein
MAWLSPEVLVAGEIKRIIPLNEGVFFTLPSGKIPPALADWEILSGASALN